MGHNIAFIAILTISISQILDCICYGGNHHHRYWHDQNSSEPDNSKSTDSGEDHKNWEHHGFGHNNWGYHPHRPYHTYRPYPPSRPYQIHTTTTTTQSPDAVTTTCIRKCPVTSEFNPVCGTNNVTYSNVGRLMCAQRCGVEVDVLYKKPCSSSPPTTNPPNTDTTKVPPPVGSSTTTPQPTRKPTVEECFASCPQSGVYIPVCGTNNFTFYNIDHLLCAKLCGIAVDLLHTNSCAALVQPTRPPNQETTKVPPVVVSTTPQPTQKPTVEECFASCPQSGVYTPVCGTINFTFNNTDHLRCAKSCGIAVEMRQNSTCNDVANAQDCSTSLPNGNIVSTSPVPPTVQFCISLCSQTEEIKPICGSDGVSYKNPSAIVCVQMCGLNVLATKPTACSESSPSTPQPLPPTLSTEPTTQKPVESSTVPIVSTVPGDILDRVFPQETTTDSSSPKFLVPSVSTEPTIQKPVESSTIPMPLPPSVAVCIQTCPNSTEYNPVCGSDGMTYQNPKYLLCLSICGINVKIMMRGPCSTITTTENSDQSESTTSVSESLESLRVRYCINSCSTTSEYNPVCGTNLITYSNLGKLQCAKKCGVKVEFQKYSKCTDDEGITENDLSFTSKVTQKPQEQFSPSINGNGIDDAFTQGTERDPTDDIDPRFNE